MIFLLLSWKKLVKCNESMVRPLKKITVNSVGTKQALILNCGSETSTEFDNKVYSVAYYRVLVV